GHLDIIRRGAALFSQLTIGIGVNPDKNPLFSPEDRLRITRQVVADLPNVSVECFSGLTIDFAKACNARAILRGIRSLSDIDSEFTMGLANKVLAPELETIFFMAGERYAHISSSLIKQIALLGNVSSSDRLREFVPEDVVQPLLEKVRLAAAGKV
ncbi:MAG: pantetheine-phosphate adenylyltransferase, partial [Planctomyces sp.]|nr:pantetheine-phosphate adenylyltransferase [Planctomyces sp.]